MHRLRSYLSDTLSRDKAETAVFLSQLLRNLHHIPAHDNRQFLMRAFIIDIKLDISKIHYMELDWSRVSGYELRQVYHLLFGSLTCIRRSMEVSGFYRHPPLRNHISGHRAVDSARQKQHSLAVRSHRHSARAWDYQGVKVYIFPPDLHVEKYVGMMHIHLCLRICLQNDFSQIAVNLIRRVGVLFIGPSRIHLECEIFIGVRLVNKFQDLFL